MTLLSNCTLKTHTAAVPLANWSPQSSQKMTGCALQVQTALEMLGPSLSILLSSYGMLQPQSASMTPKADMTETLGRMKKKKVGG